MDEGPPLRFWVTITLFGFLMGAITHGGLVAPGILGLTSVITYTMGSTEGQRRARRN